MIAFGKWKLYSRHERLDLVNDLESVGHSSHLKLLQRLRSETSFVPLLRHLLSHAGQFDIHRLDDDELLDRAAHELASGKVYLVQDKTRTSLDELWEAVQKTDVGKKFIGRIPLDQPLPEVMWGYPAYGKRAEYTSENQIVLNQAMKEKNLLSDCQWKQVIAMELGNASNEKAFNKIYGKAEKTLKSLYGKGAKSPTPSDETKLQSDFADAILQVELESRNAVIEAFNSGKICIKGEAGNAAAFDGGILTLAAYKDDPRGLKDWTDNTSRWTKMKDEVVKGKK